MFAASSATTPDPQEFVRAREARRLLGDLDEDLFYLLVRQGRIPALKIGSKRQVFPRVYIAALARYVVRNPGISLAEVDPRVVLPEVGA